MIEWLKDIDQSLFRFVNGDLTNPVLDILMPLFRNKLFWIPLYISLLVLAFFKTRNAWVLLVLAGIVILLTDTFSAQIIKPLVERLRPCNEPGFKDSVRLLVPCGSGFSFLSSHATNHFGLAILFIEYFKKWFSLKWLKTLFLLWASLIAFSQVYVGVHYPLDVICGALLGVALSYMVWMTYTNILTILIKLK